MSHYIVIERQHRPDLAIRYSDEATANRVLEHSLFIDGLCGEDCLDVYTIAEVFDGIEIVIPPDEDADDRELFGARRKRSLLVEETTQRFLQVIATASSVVVGLMLAQITATVSPRLGLAQDALPPEKANGNRMGPADRASADTSNAQVRR